MIRKKTQRELVTDLNYSVGNESNRRENMETGSWGRTAV